MPWKLLAGVLGTYVLGAGLMIGSLWYDRRHPLSEHELARENTEDARADYHRALRKWGPDSVDTAWYRQRLDHVQAAEDEIGERLRRAREG